ncbi:class I SAM-dependent methyltransferase [Flavobacterium silvisoli]|uniref:Class I SAM-dependent methyltransferase n=1 Tax=Flavobacterium silvisoli TaxID=2529433 RepID=A0A4Q9Z6V8_9FLAO|nr:class I SAM-dependent methyltransferase [Flavobacterium silvisoli]TBX71226.1 class I SAM-dependent methyltransferase [Flavobacterium silvisoli]
MDSDFHNNPNLYFKNGIYFANEQSAISYPEEGNQQCFQLEDDSFWFNHRNDCIANLVDKFSKNESFFDIGGGNGFFSAMLQKKGYRCVLVEPGIAGCLNAKARGVQDVICSTLLDAKFDENSIDNIGLFDVVEHIENDIVFLTDNYNYLKKGGKIYITVPAHQWLFSEEDVYAGHYRRYTLRQISDILEGIGFKVKYKTYFFTFLPIPLFILNAIPFRLGLKKVKKENHYTKRHSLGDNFISNILKSILNFENKRIKNIKTIGFGSSCLIVAEK